jgi:predicted NBD/HSP70 family sugar kinase
LLRLADDGNLHAAAALEKQAKEIGRGLGLMIAGLSPSMILVAGEITGAWSRFGPTIQREAAGFTVAGAPPKILPAHEGEIARLRGAAALVFQRHWPDHPDSADLAADRMPKKVRKALGKR